MKLKYLHLPILLLTICFSATAQVIQIPVVVHVVYNTPAQNISDAQILSQLQVLNEDFNRLNADTVLIPQPFKPLAATTEIRFCLAGVDPNGNATTGITRTQTTVPSFSTNNQVKFTAQGGRNSWNAAQYLNIWVCNLTGVNGYATFPGAPLSVDGVVLDYRVVGRAPANPFPGPFNRGRRGTHEVAHYLNLHHIYGNTSCTAVAGTDWPKQIAPNTGCPTFPHFSCSSEPYGDMFMNFMDETDDACKQMFTPNQGMRMRAAIMTMRSTLVTSMGCSNLPPPGWIHNKTNVVGQPVAPTYYSPLSPVSWSWTLPGASPNNSVVQSPVATYLAAGYYGATLMVSSGTATETYNCQECIRIYNYKASGRVFIDYDQNGSFSAGDFPVPGYMMNSTATGPIGTSSDGSYSVLTNTAAFTLNPEPIPHYTISPASHPFSFSTPGQILTDRDFALTPIPNQQDLSVTIVPMYNFRPGFNSTYKVIVKNKGTTIMGGDAQIQLDNNLSYVSSTGGTVSGNTVSWSFTNLQPLATIQYYVTCSLPASAITLATITSNAAVQPLSGDLIPADNSYTITHPVCFSYDPNDKTASHEAITPAQVAAAHPITYTIRFQNTGNDTAFKVMLLDTLSTMLNASTLQVLHASHPYTMQVNNEHRTVEWHFDNILLPDSTTNEPASHGYVQYRIRPNTNLVLGDEILNQAHIYFDFNEAVATNVTLTTVSLVSGTAPELPVPGALRIYPNPASGAVNFEMPEAAAEPVQATLYNTLGQPVLLRTLSGSTNRHELLLHGLPNGLYLLKVQQGDRSYHSRLVKQ